MCDCIRQKVQFTYRAPARLIHLHSSEQQVCPDSSYNEFVVVTAATVSNGNQTLLKTQHFNYNTTTTVDYNTTTVNSPNSVMLSTPHFHCVEHLFTCMQPALHVRPATGSCQACSQGPRRSFCLAGLAATRSSSPLMISDILFQVHSLTTLRHSIGTEAQAIGENNACRIERTLLLRLYALAGYMKQTRRPTKYK